ncbi:hypothetical protein J1N35_000179 [Gossypium stocksii]|uniref:Uncharacterized protein n=1 Tax=Gossypium stocksii TaxID=47602 RepID=A0A9D3WGX9_9ROSI|nr:hypothetical protein J1N35_000179 [Gossypium stocksii]
MPPRQTKWTRSQREPPPLSEFVSNKFKSKEAKNSFLMLQGQTFIFERDFDLTSSLCEEI